MYELKYSKLVFQTLVQSSAKERPKSVLKDRFLNNSRHISDGFIQAAAVSDQLPTISQRIVLLDPALSEKIAATEAKWIFKLAESDMSLRSSDHMRNTFQSMFSGSKTAKQFSMTRQKALYLIQDGIGPLENDLCHSLSKLKVHLL